MYLGAGYDDSNEEKKIAPRKGNPDCGIREIFACGIQNPGLWNSEFSSRNPESY